MWVLFHSSKKTKAVRGGESFVQRCPSCNKKSTFVEVEIEENLGVFFVDVIGDKERGYRCGSCGDMFKEDPDAAPQKSAVDIERELAAAEQKRLAEAQRRRELSEAKAVRIEDELAELKKKLGR